MSKAIIFYLNDEVVGGSGPFEFGVSLYKGPSVVVQDFTSRHAGAVIRAQYTLSNFHRNNWVETSDARPPGFIDKYYALFVAYESMDFEKEEETLVCNSGNCFAAVGGNLGLLLGFSCLSIIY